MYLFVSHLSQNNKKKATESLLCLYGMKWFYEICHHRGMRGTMGRVDHACQMMVLRSDISPNHIYLVKEDRRIHSEFYNNFIRFLLSFYD